ncbi:MAG TPA: GIY-YIG nuclease family protein [Ferruginibacter sp.]|nr:GIY-YIG nuclease family protein [Ferruginibacter sp.]
MTGPLTICDLKTKCIKKSNGVSGIYLWGVKHNDQYIPLYVGKSRNIHERIFQHLCRWNGGEYRVSKWEVIIGSEARSKAYTLDDDLLYIPHGANLYEDFLKKGDIQKAVKNVLCNFFCCWKKIEKFNKKEAQDEEDAFATLIGKYRLISSHRKGDTSQTEFAKQFFDDFNKLTK